MKPGYKHSAETRKKISKNTKKAMKGLSPNATAFKPGHKPWNTGLKGVLGTNSGSFQPVPIGTITTKKNNGYEYQYIKTESGWKRYYPNGKPQKTIKVKSQAKELKKLFATPKPQKIAAPKIKIKKIKQVAASPKKKIIIPKVEEPKPIKKTLTKEEQAERDFLAQFGYTGTTISIPIRSGGAR